MLKGCILHASHAEDRYQSDFGLSTHLQVPDKEDGQNSKSEVTYGANATIKICETHNDVDVNARSWLASVPEV